MNNRKQRGVAHIILLAILVLVALSAMARCDIDQARADELTPHTEVLDVLDTNPCRCGNNPAGPDALHRGL